MSVKAAKTISVIVPVFNTVEYLPMCLDSILNQTYCELEIILIDDGATDGSGEICNAYAARDRRIKVIHQINAGVVAARNRGIKEASGEYIAFIDSDDYIEPDMMETLKRMAEESGADIVTSGYIVEYAKPEGIRGERRYDAFPEGIYGAKEKQFFYSNLICFETYSKFGILPALWSKLFKRGLLEQNAYRVSENIQIAEDACLVYMSCIDACKIFVSHRAFYHYYVRETSCMHTPNRNSFAILDACYQCLYKKVKEIKVFQDELFKQIEMFTAREAVYCLKNRFGFSNDGVLPLYVADLKGWNSDTRIILYGAGNVGCSYYQQIIALGQADIVLWVDADERVVKKNKRVEPIRSILDKEYDYIIVAVKGKKLAEGISSDLQKMGVNKDKIIWKEPRFILDIYRI
ncbi:MAG: glycosyltransferase [Eubacterium sp.]|nr:glycosyltransferase [Eubacterium sp.]